jgi:hypothetical protein
MVSAEAKEFYGQFVGNLIDSYTKQPLEMHQGMGEADLSISFLKWKLESVANELNMRLYGEHLSPVVTFQIQEKCFDVLTDYLGRVDKTECGSLFQQWSILIYDFADRMQSSLMQLTKLPVGLSRPMVGIKAYALLTLCRMLASAIFEKHGFKDKLEFSDSRVLIGSIFVAYAKSEKLKILKLTSNVSKSRNYWSALKSYWSAVQSTVEAESKELYDQQRLGLMFYLCISSKAYATWVAKNSIPKEAKVLDSVEMLYYQISSGNIATVAEKIPVILRKQWQVSMQYAKETAPTCYLPVLDRVVDGKVKMDAPGQNTFCPVPHCRWCGLVKNPSEMLVCQFCTDKPKYPDTHLFCSSQCEDLAMKDQHGERHAEFIEYGLDLKKVNSQFNVPFASPKCILFK